jgi:hypothetical protein
VSAPVATIACPRVVFAAGKSIYYIRARCNRASRLHHYSDVKGPRVNDLSCNIEDFNQLADNLIAMATTKHFQIKEHKVQACHIREYAGSSINQNEALHLHVKQYTPLHKSHGALLPDDAITIIATHGVGLPKVYNPIHLNMDIS